MARAKGQRHYEYALEQDVALLRARIAALEEAAEYAAEAWLNGVDSYLEAPMRALMALIWPQEPRSDAPGAACDAKRAPAVSVHDTAAHRGVQSERETP